MKTTTGEIQLEPGAIVLATQISRHFAFLLADLSEFTVAEGEIEHADIWDPAFRDWLCAAEQARAALLNRLCQILATPEICVEDRVLRRVAFLMQSLVTCEVDAEFRALHKMAFRHSWLFRCPGHGLQAQKTNELLAIAKLQIAGLENLSCLDDGFDVAELDATLELAEAI